MGLESQVLAGHCALHSALPVLALDDRSQLTVFIFKNYLSTIRHKS
jgi:hypothetical protein